MYKKLLIACITALLPFPVLAAGLSVSPGSLDFKVVDKKTESQILVVSNPTADVLVFEVYPDEYEGLIEVKPRSFTLESGARKEVILSVDEENFHRSQSISTSLSVVGSALAEGKSNVAAGAKIPVSVSRQDPGNQPINKTPLIIIAGILAAAAAYQIGKKSRL